MTDLQLFHTASGQVRRSDPATSRAAAETISGKTEQAILFTFKAARQAYPSLGDYGLTDDELADWLPDLYAPTVKSARSRLSRKGLLVDSGQRRDSRRGRPSIVWRKK